MTSNARTPAEIEREIEAQQSSLRSTLEGLQDKFSVDGVVRQIGDQFREHGGDLTRTISNQVRSNPVPLAITGIGLAWMVYNSVQNSSSGDRAHNGARSHGYGADDEDSGSEQDFRRAQAAKGNPYVAPTYPASGSGAPSTAQAGPSWAHEDDVDGKSLSDRASSAKAAIAEAATSAREGTAAVGARIAEGTENMSEEGRRRVIAARQKAIDLRRSAARSAQDGADAISEQYDRQPLVFGALALAFGAALGGVLARTKTEDELIGPHRDNLIDEAERIFAQEKAKAAAVAKSVKDEVRDIAAETKADLDNGAPGDTSAVEAVGDMAKSVGRRVADKAKSTAKKQGLG